MKPFIITNPPYKNDLPEKFVFKALSLGINRIALLVKTTWFAARKRNEIWMKARPSHVLQLTWRPDFLGLKAPAMDFAWVLWGLNDLKMPTVYDRLMK